MSFFDVPSRKKIGHITRAIAAVVAALAVFSVLFFAVNAEEEEQDLPETFQCGENLTYTVEDGILSLSGEGGMTLPEEGAPWAELFDSITSVVINEGVTSVSADAFLNFTLNEITLPDSVVSIGEHAFGYSLVDEIYTKTCEPTVIGSVGSYSETWAAENGFDFPASKVVLPEGDAGDVHWIISEEGVLTLSGSGSIPSYSDGAQAPWAEYYSEKDGFVISFLVIENGVTSVGDRAFGAENGITSVSLGQTVSTIGAGAFSGCAALTEISSTGVTSVGDGAFRGCGALETVIFGSVSRLGVSSFEGSAVNNCVFGDKLAEIPDRAFFRCANLATINSPAVERTGVSSFEGCVSLQKFESGSLTVVGDRSFAGCRALTSQNIVEGLSHIGEFAFYDCDGFTSVALSSKITSLPTGVFEGCDALSSVKLTDSVRQICERALSSCPSLRSITLSKNVREIADNSIGYYYFSNDDTSAVAYAKYQEFVIEIKGPTPSEAKRYAELNGFSFVSTGDVSSDDGTFGEGLKWSVKLPAGLLTVSGSGVCPDYESTDDVPWALYNDYIRSVNFTGVKNVGAELFDGMKDITSVSLPGSVKTIGKNAFSGTGLGSVSLPSGLAEIGDGAFENCRGITSLSIPSSLRQIGVGAFKGTGIRSVYVPDTVEFIGDEALGYNALGAVVNNFLMKGASESIAQNYAEENGITFRVDGYVTLTDPASGAEIVLVGSEDEPYSFSVSLSSNTLEPDVFLASGEYGLIYTPTLTLDGAPVRIDGSATIRLPIPDGVKHLTAHLYSKSSDGLFDPVTFEIEDNKFVYSVTSVFDLILTNTDLSVLYPVSVRNCYENGDDVTEEYVVYATNGAKYLINALTVDGYTPDNPSAEGTIDGAGADVLFVYYKAVATSERETEPADTTERQSEQPKHVDALLITEIILAVLLVAVLILLVALLIRRKHINDVEEASKRRFTAADAFGDTIVVPHANDGGLDIAALFAEIENDARSDGEADGGAEPEKAPVSEADKPGAPEVLQPVFEAPRKAELYGASVSKVPLRVIKKRFRGKMRPAARKTISSKKAESDIS